MKRAVIFLHGNKPSKELVKKYVKKSDTIICADGGTIWAVECGLHPDVYIGDLDSITPELYKKLQKKENIEWHTFEKEKDETDSELAIKYAIKRGFGEILLFSVFGNRVDHVLANLTLFSVLSNKKTQIKIIEGDQEIYFVKNKLELDGKIGEYISLIPLQTDVTVLTNGLKWELKGSILKYGKTCGISNEFIQTTAEVLVKNGTLLVIHTLA